MPDTTPIYAIPYPVDADTVDVPRDLQAIADRLEVLLTGIAPTAEFKGKTITPAEQSVSITSYGLMATPDRVQNVVLPADGLILVWYQALWKEAVIDDARASLFVGANPVLVAGSGDGTSNFYEATMGGDFADRWRGISTTATGLASGSNATGSGPYAGTYPTTGHAVAMAGAPQFAYSPAANGPWGGCCSIFAAAGTYDVSVKFKSLGLGAVSVKDRRLWVRTFTF